MTLIDVIKLIYVVGDTLTTITTKLNAKTIQVINNKPSGFSDLYDLLGKDTVIILRSRLKQASQSNLLPDDIKAKLDMAFTNLDQGDFRFYDNLAELEAVRSPLSSIGINVDLLKSWASRTESLLENNKLTPTNEQIELAFKEVKLQVEKKAILDAAENRLQALREALTVYDGTGQPPIL